jgi:histidine triad (HIT) family protein
MMARSALLKAETLSLLLAAARWHPLRPLVAFFYRHMNRFLPLDRLGENTHWMAVHHPRPEYALHILILPKQAIPALTHAPSSDPGLYADLFLLVGQMIHQFDLETSGYRLITNGGPNQTIPIWHWHLVCEASCKGSDDPGDSHA